MFALNFNLFFYILLLLEFCPPSFMALLSDICRSSRFAIIVSMEGTEKRAERELRSESILGALYCGAWEFPKSNVKILRIRCKSEASVTSECIGNILKEELKNTAIAMQPEVLYDLENRETLSLDVSTIRVSRLMRKLFPMERSCWESPDCICSSHCKDIGSTAFAPEDTVLVSGGTGSLGLLTTRGLLLLNCKHIALVSRSGKIAEPDQALYGNILTLARSRHAEVRIFCCDTSDLSSVENLVMTIMAEMKVPQSGISGVIHSAGVLKDGLLATRGAERGLETVYMAKVKSCLNLCSSLASHDLKFFVCFSSIAACVGNAGQASYAFCNRALEAIMHERRSKGLPGFSVRFPGVIGAGMGRTIHASLHAMMASSNFVEHLMFRYFAHRPAFESISETLTLIPQVMMEKIMQTKLVNMYDTVDTAWVKRLRLEPSCKPSSLPFGGTIICKQYQQLDPSAKIMLSTESVFDSNSLSTAHENAESLVSEISESDSDDSSVKNARVPTCEEVQQSVLQLSKLLVRGGRRSTKDLHILKGLMSQGMDSICAVELSHQLSTLYDLPLPKTLVMTFASIARISSYIHEELLKKEKIVNFNENNVTAATDSEKPDGSSLDDICIVGVALDLPQGIQSLESYWDVLHNRCTTVDAKEVPPPVHIATKGGLSNNAPPSKLYAQGKPKLEANVREPPKVFNDPFLDDCFLRLSFAHRLNSEQWQSLDPFLKKKFFMAEGEMQAMHPAQKLLLKAAYAAVLDAGYEPTSVSKTSGASAHCPPNQNSSEPVKRVPVNTGVFVGIGGRLEGLNKLMTPFVGEEKVGNEMARDGTAYAATSHTLSVAAGRIAFSMGFEGPALAIDTACSSSLVALHQARRALQLHECDAALVLAVNTLDNHTSMACSMAQMLSKSGSCRAFDQLADGYGRSEGCGAIFLKRRRDCVRDNDRIYGIVRGSAVAQDGTTASLTAPNVFAQERVLKQALRDAKLTVNDIHFIEAHGTGTVYGDPIEISALSKVYADRNIESSTNNNRVQPLHITASKSNVGHLEAAAGMAGIFSVLASLHYRHVPSIALLNTINPLVQEAIGSSPLSLTRSVTPLDNSPGVHTSALLAGVSSFGYAGTISHVILESAPASMSRSLRNDSHVTALLQDVDLNSPSKRNNRPDLINFARSKVIVAEVDTASIEGIAKNEAISLLGSSAVSVPRVDHLAVHHVSPWLRFPVARTLAWQFTGQGALTINIARDLFDNNRIFRRYFKECDDLLFEKMQIYPSELLYPSAEVLACPKRSAEAKERLTGDTRNAQSVLIALEICLALTLIEEARVLPSMVLGHSLGEYAAMVVAGHWTIAQALTIVWERSSLIARTKSCEGVMHAIRAKDQDIQPWVDQQQRSMSSTAEREVSIAAINTDQSLVISGSDVGVQSLLKKLKDERIIAMSMPLTVKHGFHSPVMKHAEIGFSHILNPVLATARKVHDTINPHNLPPKIRIFSTLQAREVTITELLSTSYWLAHMVQPVRYRDAILNLRDYGRATTVVEIGPQPILTRLASQVFVAHPTMSTKGIPSSSHGGIYDEAKFAATCASMTLPTGLPSPLVPPVPIYDSLEPCKTIFCLD